MDVCLPDHLLERVRWTTPATTAARGELILYWMHHAVRGHENPALDVAVWLARHWDLPLLVYHAICEEYPFASDRHHVFMIQGARDVQREFSDLGIRYAFHLQRANHRGPHLRDLARRAAAVVTEEMPLVPIIGWRDRLRASAGVPIASVDTSCLVPASLLISKCYTRADEFRSVLKPLVRRRLLNAYVPQSIDCVPFHGPLPFEPVNLQHADLRQLVGACRIDHTIAPVADTPGGSRAGYARWEGFKNGGLATYATRCNDPTDHHGASRMSAYLHYGMVSTFRIARESAEQGAEKFIDELLTWRELAFHFCLHRSESVNSIDAVPEWAQRTLEKHLVDAREITYSWETLARGQTENRLWDACQRSLLKHGELHNQLRMSWGKAMIAWTDLPARALQLAIDLNHRYALDGRDPSSYGGLLWCFGQFDRPFEPEVPIYGSVRPGSIEAHEARIDLPKYLQIVDRAMCSGSPRIAVVGAGIAGLVAARTLHDHGLDVEVFEKSRGVGGRMATRRSDAGRPFDHGAQYFTVRDEHFARYVQSWVQDGVVAAWHGRIVQLPEGNVTHDKSDTARYVAIPAMTAIPRWIAAGLQVSLNGAIESIDKVQNAGRQRWRLTGHADLNHGEFDVVLLSCPPAQAAALLRPHTAIADRMDSVNLLPCWSAMIELPSLVAMDFDAAFVDLSPLSWICRNDSKPMRPRLDRSCWVLHASPQWSGEHLEMQPHEVERRMHQAFSQATGVAVERITAVGIHRWRYAIPQTVLDQDCLWDPVTRLGACGDWCTGPRIEDAFLSGAAVAGAVLRDLTIDRRPAGC